MSSMVSPLHGVVDARRWNAERLLGRLVIVVHAAFLDAGFIVPRRHRRDRDLSPTCRLPTEVGATASTLSLEYSAPQLLPRHDMGDAALRVCTNGRHVIFYLQICSVRISPHLVCLDALSVAPLLSGHVNGTARRLLGNDGSPTAALWRTVSDGFSRRIFSDLCREHGVVPGRAPTLMSLPDDAMAAILERLADGKDLLRVESTCTELRRFVADRDRQLWMPRYKAVRGNTLWCWWLLLLHGDTDSHEHLPETSTSWKEMFVRATRRREHWFLGPTPPILISPWFSFLDEWKWPFRSDSFELPVGAAACFGEMMTEDDGGRVPPVAAMAMVRRRRQAATRSRSSRVVAAAPAPALCTPRLLGIDGSTGDWSSSFARRNSLLGLLFTFAASSCDVQKHLPLNGTLN